VVLDSIATLLHLLNDGVWLFRQPQTEIVQPRQNFLDSNGKRIIGNFGVDIPIDQNGIDAEQVFLQKELDA
jgi:hypothetical protein